MVRVALAQIDPVVGDIDGNLQTCLRAVERARELDAQVVALPELVMTGYPPEDLVLKKSFVRANESALEELAAASDDLLVVAGFVHRTEVGLFNAAAICNEGRVVAIYHKQLLPNYGVFDERRYFEAGREHTLIETDHYVLGVCVCEDAWSAKGPVVSQGDAGAQLVININASPFHKGKVEERKALLCERARQAKAAIAYVNTVGGQDELVFDGGSMVVDPSGELIASMPRFVEDIAVFDIPLGEAKTVSGTNVSTVNVRLREVGTVVENTIADEIESSREIYEALRLGLRDYVLKNGFEKVVIGLSGGIDSALTATIASDAVGPGNVLGIAMPSEFSSSHSVQDAKTLAANLGIEMLEITIGPVYRSYLDVLEGAYGPEDMGLAEENLQARIRGNLLMATSNRYGHLVLATGNKSELACGYATLYGDMAGGFALLKDVFKTEVYAVARYRNSVSPVIPESTLTKPPSAELRPDQKDSDSLPPYDQLDPILEAYIEEDASIADIAAAGHDRDTVERVIAMVDRAEYKRRQAPPGPKVTTKAFGRDRRLPITNRWKERKDADLPERTTGP